VNNLPDSNLAIEFNEITKRFSKTNALKELSLTVKSGEIFGFLGPNGAGKTTAIRIITGFIKPTVGTVLINGLDSWLDKEYISQTLGFVPDNSNTFSSRSGAQLLEFWTGLQKTEPVMREEIIDRLDFPRDALDRPVRTYSQGMMKKLNIIQAFQNDPRILVLDEPTSSLDPLVQKNFFEMLIEFKEKGATIFMSSHALAEVEKICDRIGIIRKGKIIATENMLSISEKYERRMEITFADDNTPDLSSIPNVIKVVKKGNILYLRVVGPVNAIIDSFSSYQIQDLIFERARLDEIFLSYYDEEKDNNV